MGLKGIIAIAGISGLHKIIAQTKNGFVVESMSDKKRFPVSSTQQVSMLDDISIYTKTGDIKLKEVFLKMKEKQEAELKVDPNDKPSALQDFFLTIIPDYDRDRVYPSDIRKVVKWYALVKEFVAAPDEDDSPEASAQAPETEPGS